MNFLDNASVEKQLYPFTLTRSIADIRIGILTIREKWLLSVEAETNFAIPSNLLPSKKILNAVKIGHDITEEFDSMLIKYPWHIFELNDWAIRQDFELLTAGRISQKIPVSNKVINPENVFLEEGARVELSIINAATGPVYIGKNAVIMEGCLIRGPLALCEGAVLKMGTRIYGATTLGPYCVGGGEIKNSVFFGYSNKGHDGYLGDSVIGEWCNLGAGTTNSNLKNNAGEVSIWNQLTGLKIAAGQKCGLLMGDYSRSAINTSFNTGTVTGVSCNIFGEGLKGNHIPSFSWCGPQTTRYKFDKAMHDISNWKKLKKHSLQEEEVKRLKHIFDNY
jgi:UDP-N-acetylglucosamine diphosphorylase/glucosamine-1-phosphate N-acetyltransferase